MPANSRSEDTELVSEAVTWLRAQLPSNWFVETSTRTYATQEGVPQEPLGDAAIDIRSPSGHGVTLAVEAKRSLAPRDVDQLLPRLARVLRTLAGDTPVLIVTPWLSRRARELLEERRLNYIDLTGNAFVSLAAPTVFIRSQGAARDPEPAQRGRARVRGPKAGRLIRLLVDVRPPYGVRELASAAGLAPGYVSRLLDALDAEALIEREPRGDVTKVDIRGLLSRWAETYDVLKSNDAQTYLAPSVASKLLADLAAIGDLADLAVTGSFAAVRLAPVAAPGLLLVYADDRPNVAAALTLLPADKGANVALLKPFDPVVWDRTTKRDGVRYVAPSQTVVDCMTGTGRMPAEADAVLEWMLEDESRWRLASLRDLSAVRGAA